MGNDFDLGFTPEQFGSLQPEDGAGWKRLPFGDYTFKIVDGEIIPSKNAQKPHNMLKPTFEVVRAHDDRNKDEVGSQVTGLYGTANSPDFMQKRFKQLCEACKVSPGKGGLKFSQLLGKTFDATVVWEMSDSNKLDDMGRKKYWVNERVKAERVVGVARPKTLNPTADSQKAVRYLEGQDEAPAVDAAPWTAPTGTGNGGSAAAEEPVASGFMPEEEVEAVAHEYRAIYKIGGPDAESAKQALVDAGTDPDGPIDVMHLSEEIKKALEAKNGAKKSGLKPLGGKGTGTRQPRA